MKSLFSSPKAPAPPPPPMPVEAPPTPPTINTPEVANAAARNAGAAAFGSTIATSPRGLVDDAKTTRKSLLGS
jgi:hypothetical protein